MPIYPWLHTDPYVTDFLYFESYHISSVPFSLSKVERGPCEHLLLLHKLPWGGGGWGQLAVISNLCGTQEEMRAILISTNLDSAISDASMFFPLGL